MSQARGSVELAEIRLQMLSMLPWLAWNRLAFPMFSGNVDRVDSWEQIWTHLEEVARGVDDAWSRLLLALSPQLEVIARRAPIGRLRNDEDAQRDILAKVIGKLHAEDHRVVKKLIAHDDPPPLSGWMRVLVYRAAIDVMRGRPEFIRGSGERGPRWLSLATLATRDGVETPNSLVAKQREVEAFMASALEAARAAISEAGAEAAARLASQWKIPTLHTRRLVKRIDHYDVILRMALAGHSFVEIAQARDLTRREVELTIDYIEEFFHARGFAA